MPGPAAPTARVLFIGNSPTYANGLPDARRISVRFCTSAYIAGSIAGAAAQTHALMF